MDLHYLSKLEANLSRKRLDGEVESFVMSLKGRHWQRCPSNVRARLVELCFGYWRHKGFPHYVMSDEDMRADYDRLARINVQRLFVNDQIQIATHGLKLANYFHPQMWDVPVMGARTPAERFSNDLLLKKIIHRALRIWPERAAVNDVNLRGMLRTFSRTTRVSNFRPTAAKAIYERYSVDGDKVIDFSAGYGGRLLGCLPLRRHYIGIDPCSKQIQGLNRMSERLQKIVDTHASVEIHRACAEDFLPAIRKHSIDLVFSSPPYFNLERYSRETSQSYIRYPTYADWRQEFFRRLIMQSHRVLKPEGLFIVNVANVNGFPLVEDLHSFVAGLYRQTETLHLRLGHKPYLKRLNGTVHKCEPVFVFRKKHQRK